MNPNNPKSYASDQAAHPPVQPTELTKTVETAVDLMREAAAILSELNYPDANWREPIVDELYGAAGMLAARPPVQPTEPCK